MVPRWLTAHHVDVNQWHDVFVTREMTSRSVPLLCDVATSRSGKLVGGWPQSSWCQGSVGGQGADEMFGDDDTMSHLATQMDCGAGDIDGTGDAHPRDRDDRRPRRHQFRGQPTCRRVGNRIAPTKDHGRQILIGSAQGALSELPTDVALG